jgi:hypothetical protein
MLYTKMFFSGPDVFSTTSGLATMKHRFYYCISGTLKKVFHLFCKDLNAAEITGETYE